MVTTCYMIILTFAIKHQNKNLINVYGGLSFELYD